MPVKLISYTKTADESQSLLDVIAYCARVSNPANQNNTQTTRCHNQWVAEAIEKTQKTKTT